MFEVSPQQLASVRGLGTGNALLWYGRDTRCAKQASTVRDAFSKASRTADSTDCGQPPAARDAFSEACRAKSSSCRTGRIFSARNGLREETSKHKKRVLIKVCQDFLATLLLLIELYSD